MTMAVVQKDGNNPMLPGRPDDQIESGITIHIARGNVQTAKRTNDFNGLSAAGGEPESDPVTHRRGIEAIECDTCQVRFPVTIEIGKREVRGRGERGSGMNLCRRRCRGWDRADQA